MKTNKYFFTFVGFLTGLMVGISIIGLLAFTNSPASSPSGTANIAISVADAHTAFSNYMVGAAPYNQVIKAFTLDKTQLDAMNSILRENPALTGFRIYMGKDNGSNKIGIVVGIDNLGKDAVKNTIYSTATQLLSPCPPICDLSSPIIVNN